MPDALFCGQMGLVSCLLGGTLPIADIIVKNIYKFGTVGVYEIKP